MHLSRIWTPAWGVLVPYVRFDLVREFRDEGQQSDVTLMADRFRADPLDPSRPARLQTDGADRNYWTWSAGLHAQLVHGIAAFFSYRGMEGLRGFDLGEVSVGLRYEKAF